MKKVFAIALALILVMSCFAGCGSKGKDNETGNGYGTFRDYMTALPTTLNGLTNQGTATTTIASYCSAYLYMDRVKADKSGWEWTLELATQFPQQVDEEGLVWEIKIRDDFKWANGEVITVDDIIYTYQQYADPWQQNLAAANLTRNT